MFNRIKSPTWAPVPLRLIVGFGFMQHGYAKLLKGPDAFANILHGLGVPAPHVMTWLTILTELLGGFAVLLGAFVTLVSVPVAVVLLTAIFSVHWERRSMSYITKSAMHGSIRSRWCSTGPLS